MARPNPARATFPRPSGAKCGGAMAASARFGQRGRCGETGFLEFHHVVPFVKGGASTCENLELRCRTHNAYEAEQCGLGGLFARERRADYVSDPVLGLDRAI